jgi:molecular chaperone DnaJ
MATIKDYYRILNVRSSATVGEIKIAYRKLAMKYHPDRNPDDALAAAVFTDAAEAYKILADPEARKQYNYERHLTAEQEYQRPAETIETIIPRIIKINKQVQNTDPFRLNKDALLYAVKQLLPDNFDLLLHTNDNLLKQFLELIFMVAKHLSSYQTKQLAALLQPLYLKDESLQLKLASLLKQQQKEERWEKNKIVIAIIVAVILCILIFLAAGK